MRSHILAALVLGLIFQSCSNKKKVIASRADYDKYITLSLQASNHPAVEMKFWFDRLANDPGDETSLVKLAGLYAERFKLTGLIQDMALSDSLYQLVLRRTPGGNVDIYQCLAANAITQHRFRLAGEYANKALALRDKRAASLLILADVSLELGDIAGANRILRQMKNKHAFAYLIRAAKVKDHEGNLDSAIVLMERAYDRIKGNKGSAQWTLSNLADMYGHAGRIEEAYKAYLTVLSHDPQDSYALKGIAWIALSNDHNVADARAIMNALASRKRMPDAYLTLAEIAALEGNAKVKDQNLRMFTQLASAPAYKTMYHKYLANLEADEFGHPDVCISIANEEIKNRPTPQSYDLLAWGYYRKNDFAKAIAVASRYVENQTSEPDALYHLGMIYKAAGNKDVAQHYLTHALASEFELGPSITQEISTALKAP